MTSFVSQFGTGGVPSTPVTSFQYRNIGINVTITPKVFIDGEIELQISLETSTQLDTRVIAGIELPVFGTRNVTTTVRLRDGETNLIGGLIQQQDIRSVAGLPGLTDIPLLSRLFASSGARGHRRLSCSTVTLKRGTGDAVRRRHALFDDSEVAGEKDLGAVGDRAPLPRKR